eukprot:208319_1
MTAIATKSVIEHYDNDLYSLDVHDCCITKIATPHGTVYGYNITPHSFVHHWQFKILQLCNATQMFVGIHHANMKLLQSTKPSIMHMSKSISYCYGSDGIRFNNKGQKKKFGSKYHVGDTVHILLHLARGTVGFGINDSPIQDAYKIKNVSNCNYCLAI